MATKILKVINDHHFQSSQPILLNQNLKLICEVCIVFQLPLEHLKNCSLYVLSLPKHRTQSNYCNGQDKQSEQKSRHWLCLH